MCLLKKTGTQVDQRPATCCPALFLPDIVTLGRVEPGQSGTHNQQHNFWEYYGMLIV